MLPVIDSVKESNEAGEKKMFEGTPQARKTQRMVCILAVIILVGLIILWPIGGGFADWMNGLNAPADESTRYTEADGQATVSFNMDSTQFKTSGSYRSQYIWQNASGHTNYNNVTHTAGVISVAILSTAGNYVNETGTFLGGGPAWGNMHPEFIIYFDYTAKAAYADNVVRIRLYVSSLHVAGHLHGRSVTLSAGGITFFTTTFSSTSSKNYVDENISINTNDLRRAIIEDKASKG